MEPKAAPVNVSGVDLYIFLMRWPGLRNGDLTHSGPIPPTLPDPPWVAREGSVMADLIYIASGLAVIGVFVLYAIALKRI